MYKYISSYTRPPRAFSSVQIYSQAGREHVDGRYRSVAGARVQNGYWLMAAKGEWNALTDWLRCQSYIYIYIYFGEEQRWFNVSNMSHTRTHNIKKGGSSEQATKSESELEVAVNTTSWSDVRL